MKCDNCETEIPEKEEDYGHLHDEDCECAFCNKCSSGYGDWEAGEPIRDLKEKQGYVFFCCPECESNFIQ